MNNHQLNSLLSHLLGDVFGGVWACDQLSQLPRHLTRPLYFIVNTHPSHMPGEHWLALTLEKNGKSTFFDSYGFQPNLGFYPPSIFSFLKERSSKIMYHDQQLQHILSIVCGQHCVFYLCHRACGFSMSEVLSLYDDDVLKNDVMVSNFVKKYQRCIKNHPFGSFNQGTCSLKMFKDCYKL